MDDLTDPAELYRRVLEHAPGADEELYAALTKRMRPTLAGRIHPEDVDDVLHDLYIALQAKIRQDALRDRSLLWTYAASICRRMRMQCYEQYQRDRGDAHTETVGPQRVWRNDRQWEGIERKQPGDYRDLSDVLADRRAPTPEQSAIASEQRAQILDLTGSVLHGELIEKFYLREQTGAEIVAEKMAADPRLTAKQAETRYRLEKSRAKACLVTEMRNRMRRPIRPPEQMAA